MTVLTTILMFRPLPPDGATNPVEPQCSLYMRELQQFASRVASTYLAQFICTDFIMQRLTTIFTSSKPTLVNDLYYHLFKDWWPITLLVLSHVRSLKT